MAVINRIMSVNPANNVHSKVVTGMRKNQYFQYATSHDPKTDITYKELYIKAHNYFKRISATFKNNVMIKGSKTSREVVGPKANKQMIHPFGPEDSIGGLSINA